jgi:hypothetical protein
MFIIPALLATIGVPAPPVPTAAEQAAIGTAKAIVARIGDDVWPEWSKTPFVIDLLTPRGGVLLGAAKPVPLPSFPPEVEATLFLAQDMPAIVIGEPQYTQAKTPVRWTVTLLHEHFHQWQDSWRGYASATASLNLARGDKTGMWMLNYAFPYAETRVDAAYTAMSTALADAVEAIDTPSFSAKAQVYLRDRSAFRALLTRDDYRYFAFQSWQEGVARYTEIAVARGAAREHAADPAFLSAQSAAALQADANETLRKVITRLRTIPLARDKRVDFYAIGAGEALLLDRLAPGWHARYLDPRMDLGNFF